MARTLTSYEQETTINFNKAEDTASVFTYDKNWQRHIEKRLSIKPTEDNGFGGRSYEVPKKRIRPPLAPRNLSAESRARLAEKAKGLRQNRNLSAQAIVTTV